MNRREADEGDRTERHLAKNGCEAFKPSVTPAPGVLAMKSL